MEEELNENLELENKEIPNNEDSEIVEGGSDPQDDSNQVILDLQGELVSKDQQIAILEKQLGELKPSLNSGKLFLEQITADELRSEKLPELLQKLQEYVYFSGKNNLSALPGVKVGSVNDQKKESLKAEINGLLKVLGNLELK